MAHQPEAKSLFALQRIAAYAKSHSEYAMQSRYGLHTLQADLPTDRACETVILVRFVEF